MRAGSSEAETETQVESAAGSHCLATAGPQPGKVKLSVLGQSSQPVNSWAGPERLDTQMKLDIVSDNLVVRLEINSLHF